MLFMLRNGSLCILLLAALSSSRAMADEQPSVKPAPMGPVRVISKEEIEASGRASLGEFLQHLPEHSNGINTQFNNGGDGATRMNLRGLGTARTLVLLNGRRYAPGGTGADATVDLNSLPASAIERIEILEGGSAALHGADAIAGVVNIITQQEVSTRLRAFSGVSSRGDGPRYELSFTTGQRSERGNILFSAGYAMQQEVSAGARSFSQYDMLYDWRSRHLFPASSSATPHTILVGPYSDFFPSPRPGIPPIGGEPRVRVTLDPETRSWRLFRPFLAEAGGDLYNYQPEHHLVTPQQRAHVHATGGLQLGDHSRAFFEASYVHRQSAQQLSSEPLFTLTEGLEVSAQNHYNPFGRDISDVRRRMVEFGHRDFAQDLSTFRVVTGAEGRLSKAFGPVSGFIWELAYNHGRTQGTNTQQGLLQRSKLTGAIGPSFIDTPTGVARCGTPEAPIDGCVPLNLFGEPGSITPEMAGYLSYQGTARGFSQQNSLSANAGGELFQLTPHVSPARIAVGYEHRRESGAYIPDPLTAKGDTTSNQEQPTEGRSYMNEAHAELSVPVLGTPDAATGTSRDMLAFTGAARFFHYNTVGSGLTYSLGTRLSLIRDVTLRATYSTAARAPSVNELYSGRVDGYPGVFDPCSRREQGTALDAACDAQGVPDDLSDARTQLRTVGSGTENLKAETARIFTVGVVFEPRFAEEFIAAVDYSLNDVDQGISRIGADTILSSCYPSDAGKAPRFCDRIQRNADGLITLINDPLGNIGSDSMGSLDISLRYSPRTRFVRLGFSADAIWLQKFDRALAGGNVIRAKGTYDLGVYSDWKANAGVSFARDALSTAVYMRFINGFKECEFNSCTVQGEDGEEVPQPISRQVADYYVFDASVAYALEMARGTATAQLGVNNLFDAAPAVVANGFYASSDAATYDFMGRYFYLRLSYDYE